MYAIRALLVCVALAWSDRSFGQATDALPEGAIVRLGTTKFRQSNNEAVSILTPDGRTILQLQAPSTLRYLSIETGKVVRTVMLKENIDAYSNRFSLNAAGDRFVMFSYNSVTVVNPITGEFVAKYSTENNKLRGRVPRDDFVQGQPMVTHDAKAERFAYGSSYQQKPDDSGKAYVMQLSSGERIAEIDVLQTNQIQVAMSADGKRLASFGQHYVRSEKDEPQAGVVQIWDIETKKELAKIKTTSSQVQSVRFSLDGKQVFIGGQNLAVEAWDVATGKSLRQYLTRSDGGQRLFVSSDGKKLAGTSPDGHVQIWNVATGASLGSGFAPVSNGVEAIAFPAEGPAVAYGKLNSTMQVWTIPGKTLTPQDGHFSAVSQIRYTPDGKQILTFGLDNKIVRWDAKTGKELDNYSHFANASHRWPRVWQLYSATLSADSESIYLPNGNGLARVNIQTGEEIHSLFVPNRQNNSSVSGWVSTSIDGKRLVANVQHYVRNTNVFSNCAWDTESGRLVVDHRIAQDEKSPFNVMGICSGATPDGTMMASVVAKGDRNHNGPMQLEFHSFDLRTGSRIAQGSASRTSANDNSIAVITAPDNRSAIVMQSTTIQMWDIPTAKISRTILNASVYGSSPRFSPNGRLFAISMFKTKLASAGVGRNTMVSNYTISIFEWASGQIRSEIPVDTTPPHWLCFSPDSTRLAIGAGDTSVLIYDVADSKWATEKRTAPDALWDALAGDSAKRAWDAIRELSARPDMAMPLLTEKIKPIVATEKPTKEQVAKWIEQLDAPAFADRESASQSLTSHGKYFETDLRAAIETTTSLEVKERLEKIVEKMMKPVLPNVTEARAIELLERIGTADARALLTKIAAGDATHALTKDAAASLKRLPK